MESKTFAKPIYLKDGKALVREITSMREAVEFLMEWPAERRDILYEATLRTCIMAHDGLKPIKVARDALRAFAIKKNILEKEPAVQPWMIVPSSGGRAHA
jgi:hypothetical protein